MFPSPTVEGEVTLLMEVFEVEASQVVRLLVLAVLPQTCHGVEGGAYGGSSSTPRFLTPTAAMNTVTSAR
jgi:hypothetical protein